MDLMVFLATPARICIVWVSGTSLRYGNVESEKVLRAVVLPLACHDDLLLRWFAVQIRISKSIGPGFDRPHCRQPNRSPYGRDYRGCVFEIKRNFWHFARPPRAAAVIATGLCPQPIVDRTAAERKGEWMSPEIRPRAGRERLRPSVLDLQVSFDTTMFGNFEVMSLADSAILTASRRAIAR